MIYNKSHPGSYVSALVLRTNAGGELAVEAGNGTQGFASVVVDGCPLPAGTETKITIQNSDNSSNTGLYDIVTLRRTDVRTLVIQHAGVYSVIIQNSAGFVNIVNLQVDDWARLVNSVQSHGLLGQTWRAYNQGEQVRYVEGVVDDYLLTDMDSCDDVYNLFKC